jgi:hypothetical protein
MERPIHWIRLRIISGWRCMMQVADSSEQRLSHGLLMTALHCYSGVQLQCIGRKVDHSIALRITAVKVVVLCNR